MLLTEYNEEKVMEKERKEGDSARARKTAIAMINNGEPNSKIIMYTDLSDTAIEKIRKDLKNNKDKEPVMA